MKTTKFLLTLLIGVCIISCNENNPDPDSDKSGNEDQISTVTEQGKIKFSEVKKLLPYSQETPLSAISEQLHVINYNIEQIESANTDSTQQVAYHISGIDFDRFGGYIIDVELKLTNKKKIDIVLSSIFEIDDEHIYTQKGTYQYINDEKTDAFPHNIVLKNDKNVDIAEIEYEKGLLWYLNYLGEKYYVSQGKVSGGNK